MTRSELLNQILNDFHCTHRAILRNKLGDTKIPFGQKAVLFVISTSDTTNIKKIAKTLQITSGAATQHVEALNKDGLVDRSENPEDRRNAIVSLTEKGKQSLAELKKQRLEKAKVYFDEITDEELRVLKQVMTKIKKKVENR